MLLGYLYLFLFVILLHIDKASEKKRNICDFNKIMFFYPYIAICLYIYLALPGLTCVFSSSVTSLTLSWKLIRKFDAELGDKHNIQCCDKVVLQIQVLIIHSNRKQLLKMTENQLKRVVYKFQLSKHVLVCKWINNFAELLLSTILDSMSKVSTVQRRKKGYSSKTYTQ